MTTQNMRFTFSDTIAGYVTHVETDNDSFGLRTADEREFSCYLTPTASGQVARNLGEPYQDVTSRIQEMLVPGRYVFAHGLFYPQDEGYRFEVHWVQFPVARSTEYVFEAPDWWINQARAAADFNLRGQFPDGTYDWRNYRTKLYLNGTKTPDYLGPDFRQESDTMSRLVYEFATAYLLTGEERFLEAAESGTNYLRDHMRGTDTAKGIVYWYHAIDVQGTNERKVFASESGDEYDAIAAYEQVYALVGPAQLYRITGDPRIRDDIEKTITLFQHFYKDEQYGGYFSCLDPVTLDPRSDMLGQNRARKTWNSVGDHVPAYLINLVLASGEPRFGDFLVELADTIEQHFPQEDSPFVQERFYEDWSPDREWGWQQNRAIVAHDLKIAWNLMRVYHYRANDAYLKLAEKIANTMPAVGMDYQRGGWYDAVERTPPYRLVWHDRKAWWQQEQAILAYLILAGSLGNEEYRRHGRESAAFYNTFFLDHDDGGIFFEVLANGFPYLLGDRRLKGNHSTGYHSVELCYLACVYTNLLLTKQPLELHFKPKPASFPDGVLRVAPDLLPPGSIYLSDVWLNDQPYTDFDRDALTVRLPETDQDVRIRVRLAPTVDIFDSRYERANGIAKITLRGSLTEDQVPAFRRELERAVADGVERIVLLVDDLLDMSGDALRELLFLRQKLPLGDRADFYVVGANDRVQAVLQSAGELGTEGADFVLVPDETALPS
jgi:mannose/cellobiose epimerase-like protein (N-acyl-D-glucosamine 2-epimerase family)/anti-anti-sigma regulatory factor